MDGWVRDKPGHPINLITSVVPLNYIHVRIQFRHARAIYNSRVEPHILLEIVHKLARHAVLAPIHPAFFRCPQRDGAFMKRDELPFETLQFGEGEVPWGKCEREAGRRRRRGCGDVEREGAPRYYSS